MALKPDRIHVDSQIDYFMNETAERGRIAVVSTAGSGAAMDQGEQLAKITFSNPSGEQPLGVLMCDVVNLDLTRQHMNWHKEEVQIGGKVTIWNKCTVVTDQIYPGQTPAGGDVAYVGPSGYISNTDLGSDSADHAARRGRVIGKFLSSKDEGGFAKVSVNLP